MDEVDASGIPVANASVNFNPLKPRSYAYCSDTAYLPALAEVLHEVDLMDHIPRSVFPNTDLALEGEVFSVEKVEG